MYVSFKYGEFEGMRNGRYFTDMTEKSLDSLIGSINESAKCGISRKHVSPIRKLTRCRKARRFQRKTIRF